MEEIPVCIACQPASQSWIHAIMTSSFYWKWKVPNSTLVILKNIYFLNDVLFLTCILLDLLVWISLWKTTQIKCYPNKSYGCCCSLHVFDCDLSDNFTFLLQDEVVIAIFSVFMTNKWVYAVIGHHSSCR